MKAIKRCVWVKDGNRLYEKYHDKEWGVPVYDDRKIFEFVVLESAQAGLSWEIILKKRAGYKKAFANFVPKKVAKFDAKDVDRLMADAGIIRNRMKIEAAINNSKRFLEVKKEFGTFSKYMWQFVKNRPIRHKISKLADYPHFIKEAEEFSKDLKKRGFKFFGPTVAYAHMQAVGMVNDHMVGCFRETGV
jgi:DNA-3-methyladenine glycosylase I